MSTSRQSVCDLLPAAGVFLGGRRGVLAVTIVVLAAGLAFNWSWLVAVGAAPLILAALPCVAMCVLGLCMHKPADRSCSTELVDTREVEPPARVAPTDETGESEHAERTELAPPRSAEDSAPADAPLPSPEERSPVNGQAV